MKYFTGSKLRQFMILALCVIVICIVCMTSKMQMQSDHSAVFWVDLKLLSTTRRVSSFWQWQSNASLSCDPKIELLDTVDTKTPVRRDKLFPRGWHELQYTRVQLNVMQACAYSAHERWLRLASQLNIQKWSLQAGSLAGQVCYESMNAWEDDIDIVVFGDECNKLEKFFETLPSPPQELDARYQCKTMDSEFELFRMWPLISWPLYAMSLMIDSLAFVKRFKLRSRLQPYRGDILGLDIDCKVMPPEGINGSIIHDVRFGPSRSRVLQLTDMSVLGFKYVKCLL